MTEGPSAYVPYSLAVAAAAASLVKERGALIQSGAKLGNYYEVPESAMDSLLSALERR